MATAKVEIENFDVLQAEAEKLQSGEKDLLDKLLAKRQELVGQTEKLDELLAKMGHAPAKSEAPAAAESNGERTKGARAGQKYTHKSGVEHLVKQAPAGLTRPQITEQMVSELSFKPGKTEKERTNFANSIYTGGINKLMTEGVIYATGEGRPVVYRHKDNMTQAEIKAAKSAKK